MLSRLTKFRLKAELQTLLHSLRSRSYFSGEWLGHEDAIHILVCFGKVPGLRIDQYTNLRIIVLDCYLKAPLFTPDEAVTKQPSSERTLLCSTEFQNRTTR